MLLPTFKTARFLIRPYKPSDADAVWEVVSQKEIYDTTCAIPHPYPRERVDWWIQFLKNTAKNGTGYEFGIFQRTDKRYIGNVGLINLSQRHRRAEVCYFIRRESWNNQCATEALQCMLHYGFERLRCKRIGGRCMTVNPASRRVMEKCGMRYEGTARCELLKDGRFYDIDCLSILDNEFFALTRHS
ncbi:MAG: GNAT family N-acetyltransferase [Acutalibacteraceae bacterium]|nr:GNAT family N-acetyltransferase [Acutalibacteraceae bacterium]HIR03778.1 GNAT family N-acetyltransferase [Candidatus Scatovicinus merdipullorum]